MASEDLGLQSDEARRSSAFSVAGPRGLRWLSVLLLLAIMAVVWEAAKALWGIPDSRLPHLWSIAAEFGTRTRGGSGPIWAAQMLGNALVTLAGFAIGSLLGCGQAILFVASGPLERGCLPYVIGSQTVPILAIAPMADLGRPDQP